MNLLLLEDDDFNGPSLARIGDERCRHIRRVLRLEPGDELAVGRLGGQIGRARLLTLDSRCAELAVTLEREPPPPLPVRLVVAIPRPPSLRRLLQAATAMGVKQIVLLHTARCEKSYWQSSTLAPAALRRQLCLGLEQARDTMLPEVLERRRFKPFAEDELPGWLADDLGLIAHPEASRLCPCAGAQPVTLLVGPEGGFVPYELELLAAAGAEPVSLGPRPLRVEHAVVALLARLSP